MFTFMKKMVSRLVAVACTAGASLAQAQTVELNYSNLLPPGRAMCVNVIEPWIAEVERGVNGRVKIETRLKAVSTFPAQFDVSRDGPPTSLCL